MKSLVSRFFLQAFLGLVVLLLALVTVVFFRAAWVFRDRFPGYTVDVRIDPARSAAEPRPFRVGFGRVNITPPVGPSHPPVWVAGFDQGRAATGVHDDLFVVATVLDDGHSRLGIVSVDSIGIFHDDVVRIRRRLPADLKLDYTVVCATHNHSTPDLMGLWGPSVFQSGVDPNYLNRVIDASVQALSAAVASLQPARMELYEIPVDPAGLVSDTRKPDVYDADLRLMLFRGVGGDTVLGSIVGWGNHPETPWAGNTELTADFCGVIRDALERGIVYDGTVRQPGLGGTHVFVNGAVGGLMTTHPSTVVRDVFLNEDFQKPSHEKTRALGNNLTRRLLDRVATNRAPAVAVVPLGIQARTLELPLANKNFLLAGLLGLLDRGHSRWQTFRTEVALLRVGEASIACIPGEIYPEIVNGGVVKAPGGDFDIEPLEVPPLRELMPGRVKFVFGLANDEIGYIIPKSEWDVEPPHLFGAQKAPYGEVNSVGPETAYLLYSALRELIAAGSPAGR
jgi:hypothetical protein